MWTVLSGDFDTAITKEKCLENVLLNAAEGSVIVLHDSEKAAVRMLHALTGTLDYFSKKGYTFNKIEMNLL